ncbi:MAG: acyl-CoA dehydrogenase family protein [Gammaproteobacteria bacterium]
MDFTFSEEQRMMATAVRELLDDVCTPAQLRVAAGPAEVGEGTAAGGDDPARWARLVELGLPGMLAPEAVGGMGLTDIDFVLVAEETGRAALPEPLVEHAGIAVPLLAALAGQGSGSRVGDWLQRAASGEARVAITHPLNATVLGAATAEAFVLFHHDEVHLVEREAVTLLRQPSVDRLRALATVDWQPDTATCIADGTTGAVLRKLAFARGAVASAAQLLGLADRMVRIAVDYASTRQQFGKVIGSYQALKHQLADVAVQLEYAKPVVYAAAARLAEVTANGLPELSPLRALTAHVSGAKLMAGEAAELASRRAMQAHGAMGYSWEVDLHFYMKRAWALGGSWGDRAWHQRRLETAVLEGAGVGSLL